MTDKPKEWWRPSRPFEIKPIPWLAPSAVAYLEKLLTPDMKVLEFGAGGSTLWLAERVNFVTTIEHDPDWQMIVKKNAPENVCVSSNLGLIPQGPLYFDLLFIDGAPVKERAQWIKNAPQLVKPGGWVVVDNCNRPEYIEEFRWLRGQATEATVLENNSTSHLYIVTAFLRMP